MEAALISLMASGYSGGIMRTTIRLANAFHSKGYRVHLLSGNRDFPYARELMPGILIKRIRTFNRISGIPFMMYYMLKNRPAVMLAGVIQHTVLAVRVKSLLRSQTRIYAAVRNPYSIGWADHPPAKRALKIRNLKKYYPLTNGIISNSDSVARDFSVLAQIPLSKIRTIYNPALDENIEERMHQTFSHPWFKDKDLPLILFVGRLEKQKNIPLLLAAFERVRQKTPCRLTIIGDGSLKTELEEQVRTSAHPEDVDFLGFQENPFPFMERADVMVLPSSWEGFGNVIVEALATGTPVVATDCPGGPGEILVDEKLGRLVPMDDPLAMAVAIEDLLRDPPPRKILRRAAERFAAPKIADEYLDAFGLAEYNR